MDGLECKEIQFSSINLGDRIDAEYFEKKFIAVSEILKKVNTKPLDEFVTTVASAFYPAATQLYSIGDTAFVRCVDCINYPIITKEQDTSFEKIPYSFGKEHSGISFLKRGEIVITKVGTPCYASIVEDYAEIALSRTVLGLSQIHGVDPYYLLVFLRSKYGFEQLYRQRELTIQYQLTLPRVKAIKIYLPSDSFQQKIRTICQQYNTAAVTAKKIYENAENVLLNKLQLNSEVPNKSSVAVKKFSESFSKYGRLDAEYYQPKYDYYNKKILEYPNGYASIDELAKYIFTGEYSEEYSQKAAGKCFYVRGTNMNLGRIEPEGDYYVDPANHSKFISCGDIVTTRVGSVGSFAEVDETLDNTVCSDNVICFRLPDYCRPDVYTLLLNSKPMHELITRFARGSVQQRLNQETLRAVIVPVLEKELQYEISSYIQESFVLKHKSKELFEAAKQSVEIAIEKGESSAMAWLQENVVKE